MVQRITYGTMIILTFNPPLISQITVYAAKSKIMILLGKKTLKEQFKPPEVPSVMKTLRLSRKRW